MVARYNVTLINSKQAQLIDPWDLRNNIVLKKWESIKIEKPIFINIFIVTFDQFNVSPQNKIINFFKK